MIIQYSWELEDLRKHRFVVFNNGDAPPWKHTNRVHILGWRDVRNGAYEKHWYLMTLSDGLTVDLGIAAQAIKALNEGGKYRPLEPRELRMIFRREEERANAEFEGC